MTDKYLYGINGIIVPSVTSSNLNVALKNFDNTNFSASNVFVHKIGGVPRSLTSSLSVTINAGANTFFAGHADVSTREIDYFVYLGWRASNSSMFILVSRIPYANSYADFSATATDTKYGAYSGSAPASTDRVVNIGRFTAVNGGAASYNWSIPASALVIHHPISDTRFLSYGSFISGTGGTQGAYAETVSTSIYKVAYNSIELHVCKQITNKGSWTGSVLMNLPILTIAGYASGIHYPPAVWANAGAASAPKALAQLATTYMAFLDSFNSSYFDFSELAVNDWINFHAHYPIG